MKILVAEDEPEILRLYKIILENEGHEVMTVKDGDECMKAYKYKKDFDGDTSTVFDLLILDYRMPKKTGLEVAEEVLNICPSQQILLITAYAGELNVHEDILRKIRILRKPFGVDELISFLRNMFVANARISI